jgi:hypothetical protein
VYDPKSKAGVIFVGINNPHVTNPQENYLIRNDVCLNISWGYWDQKNIARSYAYCCEVDDFRSTFNYLPQFTVSGLLTEGGNGNGNGNGDGSSSLRLGQYFNRIVLMEAILKFLQNFGFKLHNFHLQS